MKLFDKEYSHLSHFEFLAKQTVDGFITGLHKSPYHGFSVEFSEHKQYNDGDSSRFIDWKVFAKTDKLFVKKFDEETNLRCRILLDISSSMYYPIENKGKIKFAAFATACLAFLLQKQRDAVGLSFFDDKIGFQSQVKSTSMHVRQLMGELEKLPDLKSQEQGHKSHVSEAIHLLAENIHKRSLVIIFSDMMDNSEQHVSLFNALQHLKHNKHEVLLFHVYDGKKELDFDFESRPYQFVDVETGEKLLLNPSEIKEEVKKEVMSMAREVMLKCTQYKIDYIRADIHDDVEKVLEAYLVKRRKMG
jgi:uncharacterized protein (DUF58 family)